MSNECLEIKPDTPFTSYYFDDDKFTTFARKCMTLIDRVNVLEIYETRRHSKREYVCWYVSFKGIRPEKICFILQFEIRKSNITIGFRHANFAPKEKFKKTPSIINRGKSLGILYNHYRENELIEIISGYLKKVQENLEEVEKHCRKRRPCENQKVRRSE